MTQGAAGSADPATPRVPRDMLVSDEVVERAAKIEWEYSASLKWEQLAPAHREHFCKAMRSALEAVAGDLAGAVSDDIAVNGGTDTVIAEWRILAEWDWVECHGDELLHAVKSVENDVDKDWLAVGEAECGIQGQFWIPGLISRMHVERCPDCCAATDMPLGKQSPKNIDECRSTIEARIAALKKGERT